MNNTSENMAVEETQAINSAAEKTMEALDVAIDVLGDLQSVVSSGRAKKVKVKYGDKVLTEMPVALTAAAAFAAGLAAVLLTKLAIEIVHEE